MSDLPDVYDRARPGYPTDVVDWLVGDAPVRVLELGAGTGKLTELLVAAGHQVIATDPSAEMLAKLRERAPGATAVQAPAEAIPVPSRSIDVVVCAESFHAFDHGPALTEIARVLREDGHLALVRNVSDQGIPWVRKLNAIVLGGGNDEAAHLDPVADDECFGPVQEQTFRFWQDLRRNELVDLVRSQASVAALADHQREDVLARVGALYDDYGRGPDGMRLPYLTRCHRAKVTNQPPPPVVMQRVEDDALSLMGGHVGEPGSAHSDVEHSGELTPYSRRATVREDTGTLLIDFS